MPNTATEKQVEFIKSLKAQRDLTAEDNLGERLVTLARELWAAEAFTKEAASATIEGLKGLPYVQRRSETPSEAVEGMHRVDGVVYKVQRSPESGRLYAKKLVFEHHHDIGDSGLKGIWKFEYAKGAMRLLSAQTQMTLEEAKEWGVLYGTCCVCGRTLTNEESIAAGIGPICSGKGFAA